MCITLDNDYPKQADGAIRYKVVEKYFGLGFSSLFRVTSYEIGVRMIRDSFRYKEDDVNTHGFHLFVNLNDALDFIRANKNGQIFNPTVLVCKCENFVAGGGWGGDCEIWQIVTPLRVLSLWDRIKNWFFGK